MATGSVIGFLLAIQLNGPVGWGPAPGELAFIMIVAAYLGSLWLFQGDASPPDPHQDRPFAWRLGRACAVIAEAVRERFR
jgi:hypothetical protein